MPDDIDALLTLKGVGRKTANLVVTQGFNRPGICVDVHVHRISNRWGYVKTRNPEETGDGAPRATLPRRYWIGYNDLLVSVRPERLPARLARAARSARSGRACPRKGVSPTPPASDPAGRARKAQLRGGARKAARRGVVALR